MLNMLIPRNSLNIDHVFNAFYIGIINMTTSNVLSIEPLETGDCYDNRQQVNFSWSTYINDNLVIFILKKCFLCTTLYDLFICNSYYINSLQAIISCGWNQIH